MSQNRLGHAVITNYSPNICDLTYEHVSFLTHTLYRTHACKQEALFYPVIQGPGNRGPAIQ